MSDARIEREQDASTDEERVVLNIYPWCENCWYGHVDHYYGDFDCDMDIKYGHCPFECHIESITFNGKDIIENIVEN